MKMLRGEKRYYVLVGGRWIRAYRAGYAQFVTKNEPNILKRFDDYDVKTKML